MEVLSFLRSRNRCLERYLSASQTFLNSAERGDFSGLESVQAYRDSVLRAIDLFNRKISASLNITAKGSSLHICLPTLSAALPDNIKEEISWALSTREVLIHKILATDTKILLKLDEEKARIQRELGTTRKGGEIVRKFKSEWVGESGEGLDRKL